VKNLNYIISFIRILVFFLCCLIHSSIQAQTEANNFSNESRNLKVDTSEINKLNTISASELNKDYNKALAFGEAALKKSQQIKYKTGEAESFYNIAQALYRQNKLTDASANLTNALELNIQLKNAKGIAMNYNAFGDIYFSLQKFDSCVMMHTKALKIFTELGDNQGIVQSNNKIGKSFFTREKYKIAMEYYLKSLKLAEESGMKSEIAKSYVNVSNVVSTQGNPNAAIVYLKKALILFQELDDQYYIGICLNNIAANYIEQDSLQLAINYLKKSQETHTLLNDLKGEAAAYLNMGIVSDKNKEFTKAVEYYNAALHINEKLNDKYRILTCLSNLSVSYRNLKWYDKVIANCERGLKMAEETNAASIKKIFYENLSATYDSLQDYKNAFENYKLLKQMDDSLFLVEKRAEILEMEAKYQSEKKEIQISNLTKDVQLQAVELANKKNLQIFLLVTGLLALFLLIVYYRLYALKLNSSKLLSQKNKDLEKVNESLTVSESTLLELNATKDKFFTIIAHDINNTLSAYRSVTKMLAQNFYDLSEQKKLEQIIGISKSSENLYNLLQNLLQWSTSQTGTMPFNPKEIDLGIIAFKAVTLLQDSADKKNIDIAMNIHTNTFVFADINMVSIIMLNLVSNAIKYSHINGNIQIDAKEAGDFFCVSISDNGIGISKEDIPKLFRVEFDHKTIGNSNEKGTGIGLILCYEFVLKNGGNIWVESEIGKGSTFIFTLPKIK